MKKHLATFVILLLLAGCNQSQVDKPTDAIAHNNRGYFHYRQGDDAAAEKDLAMYEKILEEM